MSGFVVTFTRDVTVDGAGGRCVRVWRLCEIDEDDVEVGGGTGETCQCMTSFSTALTFGSSIPPPDILSKDRAVSFPDSWAMPSKDRMSLPAREDAEVGACSGGIYKPRPRDDIVGAVVVDKCALASGAIEEIR